MAAPPGSVTIGPHTYEVRSDEDSARQLRAEQRKGDSSHDALYVRVDIEGPHTGAAETLLHEILHMCWQQAALHSVPALSENEEHAVTALSPMLLDALRRNPTFVAYLLGDG